MSSKLISYGALEAVSLVKEEEAFILLSVRLWTAALPFRGSGQSAGFCYCRGQ